MFKKRLQLKLLPVDASAEHPTPVILTCGNEELELCHGYQYPSSKEFKLLKKMGFYHATYVANRKEQKLKYTFRADDVEVIGVGICNVILEFNADTELLTRVTIFNQNDFSKRDVLSKCQWLKRLESLLQMPSNAKVNADFRLFHQPDADKYYDFKTIQIRPDTTAFYGANDVDTSLYLQSQFVLTRGLKLFATLQTNSFFDGVEVRYIYS